MKTKRVDGALFERMIRAGMHSLSVKERELNSMNVFPVADGDTGTNMLNTLRNGISCAHSTANLSEYLSMLSSGMLLGARGNSGVILSQIFKGIHLELIKLRAASVGEMRNAFIRGYKVAYESVLHPAEGTILTVCREGIERAVRQLRRIPDVETLLESYISNMELSLADTPNLLPVLREMGVVDSGGMGYICIIKGMLACLTGEELSEPLNQAAQTSVEAPGAYHVPDLSLFDESSRFEQGYCMEFILQRMNYAPYEQDFSERSFTDMLESLGNSIVTVFLDSKVKVHIHTLKPAPIVSYAQRFGEFLTFKLENMQLQHNEYMLEKHEHAPEETRELPLEHKQTEVSYSRPEPAFGVIAAVNGEGNAEIFKNLGCGEVINCSATMNASSEEFVNALERLNAKHTVILPGNPNLLLASRQAAEISGREVTVLPSRTLPESYFALAMDVQDSDDIPRRIEAMREGISSIDTLLIATAAKSFEHRGVSYRMGDCVVIHGGEPVVTALTAEEAATRALELIDDIDDKESCILFRGADVPEANEALMEKAIRARYPHLECSFLYGGQAIYGWMIGLV